MADKTKLETGEILMDDDEDKSLKQDLDTLAKDINVKESSMDKVDKLFNKLDSVELEAKNRAFQYALKNAKITVGNTEKTIAEISEVFGRATEQEQQGSWKIKLKDSGVSDEDKQLVEGFLNEKGSALARLIQLSSQHTSLQASRGYGRENADGIIDVGVDNVFGNQTRRALSGLKEWVEGDYTKDVESLDVKNMKVEDVLKLEFISGALKEKIVREAEDEAVKNLWDNDEYELKNKYTNNFALKKKVITVDNPKRQEGKQYDITYIADQNFKSYKIPSVDELPASYTREDPENYDESNEDSYPTCCSFVEYDKEYIFFSNGRCATSDGMKNSKDVVNELKNEGGKDDKNKEDNTQEYSKTSPEYTSDNITAEEMRSYVNKIKEKCIEALNIRNDESLGVTYEGKKLKFTLGTGETQLQNVITTTYGATMTTSAEQILSESFDIKECLKGGSIDDPEYGNIDIDYVEKIMIKSAKENLVNQKKAIKGQKALVAKYREKKNGFTLEDLFNGDSVLKNDRKKGRLNTFFSKFDDKKLVLDKDTTYEGNTIKLEFDDSWGNEPYNVRKTNNDLKIEAEKFVKDDYTIDEPKFKEELKTIILKIIERKDFN